MHQLYRPLFALTLSVAAFSCAAAVPVYTKVAGKSLDFYYAADAFQGASAYALGDTLMVQPGRGFSQIQYDGMEVVAVAHSGHALTAGGGLAMQGYFSAASDNALFRLDGFYETNVVHFNGGSVDYIGPGVAGALTARITPAPGQTSALWQLQTGGHVDLGRFSALGVYSRYWGDVHEYTYGGLGEVGITGLMYTFDQVTLPPSPVPEPQTYAMLLGGLALVGAAARRRRARRA